MLAIISPAKTLDFVSPLATEKFTLPDFAKESQELIKTLRKYDPAAISNLMGISDKLAALNHDAIVSGTQTLMQMLHDLPFWLLRATFIWA